MQAAKEFQELYTYISNNVCDIETIISLPGEEPLYFSINKLPALEISSFDYTLNPWNTDQLLTKINENKITWIILKQNYQGKYAPLADMDLIESNIKLKYSLTYVNNGYRVYKYNYANICVH